ncbi:MAG: hypothetical protein KA314_14830 [Chloroflexi bacterium]|nr:hypothetical protein [Chloroflexota bacterium]MBP8057109.1 hypothetical protein [Chloroflexota bacterium]
MKVRNAAASDSFWLLCEKGEERGREVTCLVKGKSEGCGRVGRLYR